MEAFALTSVFAFCCESTRSLFRWFTCLRCRTWPGVSFGLGSVLFFLCVGIILCSGLTVALSLVASLRCLSLLSTPLPVLLMRLLNRPNGGVVLGKHKRRKMAVCHIYYILPPTTIAGYVQRQIVGYTDPCLTSHRSSYHLSFLLLKRLLIFTLNQGTVSESPGLSGSLWFHLDVCFPTLLMGIHVGDSVKSLSKVRIP